MLLLFIGSLAFASESELLLIEGKYQNKNIYVQNSYAASGVGYCAYEVRVNGNVTTDEVNSSAFEIDLRNFNLQPGDGVTIQILHKGGCSPRILNPEALKPRPSFKTESITISNTGLITWSTLGETGSLPFIVEQYRWNKWVYVGEVEGIGKPTKNTYSFQITAPHSGENRFRVKQVGFNKEVRMTPDVKYTPTAVAALTYTVSKDTKTIDLSGESMYEMYDVFGNVVLRGVGKKLDIADFDKGLYYVCFDNQVVEVRRK